MTEKLKIWQFFFWIIIFAIYFCSELVLRTYYIYGSGNSKEQLEELAKKIPGVLKDTIDNKNRNNEARQHLDIAIRSGDKEEIIDSFYNFASQNAESEQNEIYRELLKMFPDDPKTMIAYITVMSSEDPQYNYNNFIAKLDKMTVEERTKTFISAWYKLKTFTPKEVENAINYALKNKLQSGEMFNVYNDMISIRLQLSLPIDLDSQLESQKSACFAMFRKMQLELLKEKNKAK